MPVKNKKKQNIIVWLCDFICAYVMFNIFACLLFPGFSDNILG